MLRPLKNAFGLAAPPSLALVIIGAYIVVTRWSKFVDDPASGIISVGGLILIVFLTYFVLALAGFEPSPQGTVKVPRLFAWPLLCAVAIIVFGVLFYLLRR